MGLMTKEVRGMDKVNDYSDYSYLHEIIEFLNLKTIFHNQASEHLKFIVKVMA